MFICEEDGITDGCSTNDHNHFSKLFAHNFTINRVLICVSFPEILKTWNSFEEFVAWFMFDSAFFETNNWRLLAMCASHL